MIRRLLAATCAAVLGVGACVPTSAGAASAPLTNLAHLDFLTTAVTPPAQAGHTTYRLRSQPSVGVLWVYTDRNSDGSFTRTGGGTYDAATDTYGQGSFDADDISRAAVVYLRHWKQFGDAHSRQEAYELLRGLTYLQTSSGPDAGDVVLWMQPDGSLNPTPTPADTPNPSDSSASSYWVARTLWALGEGYAAFKSSDPAFASFLAARADLAIAALNRDVLDEYGTFHTVDGRRTPAWLIADGADATSEAVLGLSAYVRVGGSAGARRALSEFSRGIADLGTSSSAWPYGALLPSALSLSQWHAWAAQMPSALAAASAALKDRSLLPPAVANDTGFAANLLTATGPDNGLSPTPSDSSQIAYGADALAEGLYSVGAADHSAGLQDLAGIAAGWFFGQNASGRQVYDPATGVTDDGVSADGTVNENSGAESTIHGLLTMLMLDAHPALKTLAEASGHVVGRDGQRVVEAESGTLTGPASVVTADPSDTAEYTYSGGKFVSAGNGSNVTVTVPASGQPRLVEPVVHLTRGNLARTVFSAGGTVIGTVWSGAIGAQGDSAEPGTLLPVSLARPAPAATTTITARTYGATAQIDALLVTPVVSTVVTNSSAVLSNRSQRAATRTITLPSGGTWTVSTYNRSGERVHQDRPGSTRVTVVVPAYGFALVLRS